MAVKKDIIRLLNIDEEHTIEEFKSSIMDEVSTKEQNKFPGTVVEVTTYVVKSKKLITHVAKSNLKYLGTDNVIVNEDDFNKESLLNLDDKMINTFKLALVADSTIPTEQNSMDVAQAKADEMFEEDKTRIPLVTVKDYRKMYKDRLVTASILGGVVSSSKDDNETESKADSKVGFNLMRKFNTYPLNDFRSLSKAEVIVKGGNPLFHEWDVAFKVWDGFFTFLRMPTMKKTVTGKNPRVVFTLPNGKQYWAYIGPSYFRRLSNELGYGILPCNTLHDAITGEKADFRKVFTIGYLTTKELIAHKDQRVALIKNPSVGLSVRMDGLRDTRVHYQKLIKGVTITFEDMVLEPITTKEVITLNSENGLVFADKTFNQPSPGVINKISVLGIDHTTSCPYAFRMYDEYDKVIPFNTMDITASGQLYPKAKEGEYTHWKEAFKNNNDDKLFNQQKNGYSIASKIAPIIFTFNKPLKVGRIELIRGGEYYSQRELNVSVSINDGEYQTFEINSNVKHGNRYNLTIPENKAGKASDNKEA